MTVTFQLSKLFQLLHYRSSLEYLLSYHLHIVSMVNNSLYIPNLVEHLQGKNWDFQSQFSQFHITLYLTTLLIILRRFGIFIKSPLAGKSFSIWTTWASLRSCWISSDQIRLLLTRMRTSAPTFTGSKILCRIFFSNAEKAASMLLRHKQARIAGWASCRLIILFCTLTTRVIF